LTACGKTPERRARLLAVPKMSYAQERLLAAEVRF
jgi:hypothetical protein